MNLLAQESGALMSSSALPRLVNCAQHTTAQSHSMCIVSNINLKLYQLERYRSFIAYKTLKPRGDGRLQVWLSPGDNIIYSQNLSISLIHQPQCWLPKKPRFL